VPNIDDLPPSTSQPWLNSREPVRRGIGPGSRRRGEAVLGLNTSESRQRRARHEDASSGRATLTTGCWAIQRPLTRLVAVLNEHLSHMKHPRILLGRPPACLPPNRCAGPSQFHSLPPSALSCGRSSNLMPKRAHCTQGCTARRTRRSPPSRIPSRKSKRRGNSKEHTRREARFSPRQPSRFCNSPSCSIRRCWRWRSSWPSPMRSYIQHGSRC